MKFGYIYTLAFVLLTAAVCMGEDPTPSAADRIAASQKRLKENQDRTDALYKREEDLAARSERNMERYEKILATWEKQQAQFQAYLDGLTKK